MCVCVYVCVHMQCPVVNIELKDLMDPIAVIKEMERTGASDYGIAIIRLPVSASTSPGTRMVLPAYDSLYSPYAYCLQIYTCLCVPDVY